VEVGGVPLIEYPINALVHAGVSQIGVVVGYKSDILTGYLREHHPYISVIYNENFDGGNALSVLSGRDFVGDDPFFVCMADHIISSDFLESLQLVEDRSPQLCIDFEARLPSQIDDATRVLVGDDGFIKNIGKDIVRWNAIDTGVFRMPASVFDTIDLLISSQGLNVSITDTVVRMGDQGSRFSTHDVSGKFWADIDTHDDYNSIDRFIRDSNGLNIRRVGVAAR
jgi:choline kinase